MNPILMIAGIGAFLLHGKKRKNSEREANRKMDALLERHKHALREGRLLTDEI